MRHGFNPSECCPRVVPPIRMPPSARADGASDQATRAPARLPLCPQRCPHGNAHSRQRGSKAGRVGPVYEHEDRKRKTPGDPASPPPTLPPATPALLSSTHEATKERMDRLPRAGWRARDCGGPCTGCSDPYA